MEESSEKRRERLQAMRAEASSQQQPLSSATPAVHTLSNPLLSPAISSAGERSPQSPRFDFYTDPMAAFSSCKRRNLGNSGGSAEPYYPLESFSSPIRSPSPLSFPSIRPNVGPRSYGFAPTQQSSVHQFQTNQPSGQSSWQTPIQAPGPFPSNLRGTPPSYAPSPYPYSGSGGGGGSGSGSPGHGFTSNYSPMGGATQSPGFRFGGSPSPQGRYFSGSNSSSRPGRSGGRGYNNSSGRYQHQQHQHQHQQQFYSKTMVEDPWRELKPVVGNILVPLAGPNFWLPKSIAAPMRPKVAESGGFKSQLSLAESLALAMEEAADDV